VKTPGSFRCVKLCITVCISYRVFNPMQDNLSLSNISHYIDVPASLCEMTFADRTQLPKQEMVCLGAIGFVLENNGDRTQ
jgi:hypothetical protein